MTVLTSISLCSYRTTYIKIPRYHSKDGKGKYSKCKFAATCSIHEVSIITKVLILQELYTVETPPISSRIPPTRAREPKLSMFLTTLPTYLAVTSITPCDARATKIHAAQAVVAMVEDILRELRSAKDTATAAATVTSTIVIGRGTMGMGPDSKEVLGAATLSCNKK